MKNKQGLRYFAIICIAMSFILYFVLPLNMCLPFSYCVIGAITVIMMVISEALFWIGGIILGKDVIAKFKIKDQICRLISRFHDREGKY